MPSLNQSQALQPGQVLMQFIAQRFVCVCVGENQGGHAYLQVGIQMSHRLVLATGTVASMAATEICEDGSVPEE
jgi:hypothetical protein